MKLSLFPVLRNIQVARYAIPSTRPMDIRILGRRNANEDFVPSMMLARNLFASAKCLVKHLAILHLRHINQSPSRNATCALPAYLPTKESLNPFLNTVIMWLDNSFLAFVSKLKQASVFDC
jgi:hypothetical protein